MSEWVTAFHRAFSYFFGFRKWFRQFLLLWAIVFCVCFHKYSEILRSFSQNEKSKTTIFWRTDIWTDGRTDGQTGGGTGGPTGGRTGGRTDRSRFASSADCRTWFEIVLPISHVSLFAFHVGKTERRSVDRSQSFRATWKQLDSRNSLNTCFGIQNLLE